MSADEEEIIPTSFIVKIIIIIVYCKISLNYKNLILCCFYTLNARKAVGHFFSFRS